MSEKLKPNFTQVPNVIFDSLMRQIASGPLRVLLAICRYTYGWGKQSDRISLGQLAEMTNLDRSNVHRAVKQLGPLLIVKPGNPRRNQASEYRLNIEIPDADLVSPRQQDLVSPGQQPVVRPVVTSATIQRNPNKEEKYIRVAEQSVSKQSPKNSVAKIGDENYPWPSPKALFALYNKESADEFPAVENSSPARIAKAEDYLKKFPDIEFWRDVMAETRRSKFLRGLNSNPGEKRFLANFDWLLSRGKETKVENCVRVQEGIYRDEK